MPIPTRETANKITALLARTGDDVIGRQSASRGTARSWRPLIVRCDSATPAYGSGVGAQCYPATVLDLRASDTEPEDLGEVWLTLLTNAGVAVPVEDRPYEVLLAGELEIDGETRLRVFGIASDALLDVRITAKAGTGLTAVYTGSVESQTALNTWSDVSPTRTLTRITRLRSNILPPDIVADGTQSVQVVVDPDVAPVGGQPAYVIVNAAGSQLEVTFEIPYRFSPDPEEPCDLIPTEFAEIALRGRDLEMDIAYPPPPPTPPLSPPLAVEDGGTGRDSLTAGQLLAGDGTNDVDSLSNTRVSGESLELKVGTDQWISFGAGSY